MPDTALGHRMTSSDASFLYFERPTAPLHIGSTSLLDGHISCDELIAHFASRIHRIPRYRELATFDGLNLNHPAWEPDPAFDVARHVEEVVLPAGSGQAELLSVIARVYAPMLPRDRPLWKVVLIQGLPEGRSAMTSLVHHCMVDGVSGIELLQAVTDLTPDAEPEAGRSFDAPPPLDPFARTRNAWFDAVESAVTSSNDALRRMLDPQRQADEMRVISRALASAAPAMLQPAPPTPFNRPVGGGRAYSVLPTSFAEIRGVRAVLGGTMNDVVLSTLAGGLGAYLRATGEATAGVELRAMIPVNVRSESNKQALGNQVSMMIAPLLVGVEDAADRHRQLSARMSALKEANQAGGFALLARLSESLPAAYQAFAGLWAPQTQPLFNIVCTNVPGPQVPLYIRGRKFETLWPLLPVSMGLGLGCALTSYNGVLYWGFTCDPELVPDIDRVAAFVSEAFESLKSAAAKAA
ncbi:MAG: wax ester/triacylglycerol synthase family O-acyltransferase [Dehalococcoidia bacterium]